MGSSFELSFSGGGGGVEGDDDHEVMEVPSPAESISQTKKKWNVFPPMKLIGKNNKVSYPFLENPDEREEMMYICFMQSKLLLWWEAGVSLKPCCSPSSRSN
jgi:hypothetical protein